jgi:hypothetical protein
MIARFVSVLSTSFCWYLWLMPLQCERIRLSHLTHARFLPPARLSSRRKNPPGAAAQFTPTLLERSVLTPIASRLGDASALVRADQIQFSSGSRTNEVIKTDEQNR